MARRHHVYVTEVHDRAGDTGQAGEHVAVRLPTGGASISACARARRARARDRADRRAGVAIPNLRLRRFVGGIGTRQNRRFDPCGIARRLGDIYLYKISIYLSLVSACAQTGCKWIRARDPVRSRVVRGDRSKLNARRRKSTAAVHIK